jgi:predicted TIM-barrel fold metal-dependent hydrolase
MIIDCHCHAGTGDGLTQPSDTRAPLERYLRRASATGIRQTVLFAPFHSDYREANREVARIVATRPERFYGFAFVHPERDRRRMADLVREGVEELGLVGIKAHRHDAPLNRAVLDAARAFHVPLLYDPMNEVAPMALAAEEYPDVNLIIPHLGSYGDNWKAQRETIDLVARYPNVYADTAGVRLFDMLEEAVRRAGARKLLFGSDGPWLHPGVELEKIRCLRLTQRETDLICGGNLLRLLSGSVNRRRTAMPPASAPSVSRGASAAPAA